MQDTDSSPKGTVRTSRKQGALRLSDMTAGHLTLLLTTVIA